MEKGRDARGTREQWAPYISGFSSEKKREESNLAPSTRGEEGHCRPTEVARCHLLSEEEKGGERAHHRYAVSEGGQMDSQLRISFPFAKKEGGEVAALLLMRHKGERKQSVRQDVHALARSGEGRKKKKTFHVGVRRGREEEKGRGGRCRENSPLILCRREEGKHPVVSATNERRTNR